MDRREFKRGFGLVELLVAVAITGIVVVGTATYLANVTKATQTISADQARDEILSQMRKAVRSMTDVRGLAELNDAAGLPTLRNCLVGQTAAVNGCTATNPAAPQALRLLVPGQGDVTGLPTSGQVYFGRNGGRCRGGDARCRFWRPRASFWARCPNDAAVCSQAKVVTVKIEVQSYDGAAGGGPRVFNGKAMAPRSETFTFFPFSFQMAGEECGDGAEMKGIDADGKIICECRFNFLRIGSLPDGKPICATNNLTCTVTQILQGRDTLGRPICRDVVRSCGWINFDDKDATCPNGGWLERIDLGVCRAEGGGKKDEATGISCDRNRGYCCWFRPS